MPTRRLDPSVKAQRALERRKKSAVRVDGSVACIELLNGGEAVVDAADAELVAGVGWSRHQVGDITYVCSSHLKGRRTYLHRFLVGTGRSSLVDHVDLDGLNNRRSNLRVASKSENGANRAAPKSNTSGAKGVIRYWRNPKLWVAQIGSGRKHRYLGTFDSRDAAATAYFAAALKQYGEFARAR